MPEAHEVETWGEPTFRVRNKLLPCTPARGRRDYFDVWVPDLAPSAPLVSWASSQPLTSRRWATLVRRYRVEMRRPAAQRLIALLAALSARQNFSVGCYCADESRCHRSVLRELLRASGAVLIPDPEPGSTRSPSSEETRYGML